MNCDLEGEAVPGAERKENLPRRHKDTGIDENE